MSILLAPKPASYNQALFCLWHLHQITWINGSAHILAVIKCQITKRKCYLEVISGISLQIRLRFFFFPPQKHKHWLQKSLTLRMSGMGCSLCEQLLQSRARSGEKAFPPPPAHPDESSPSRTLCRSTSSFIACARWKLFSVCSTRAVLFITQPNNANWRQ